MSMHLIHHLLFCLASSSPLWTVAFTEVTSLKLLYSSNCSSTQNNLKSLGCHSVCLLVDSSCAQLTN